MRPGSALSPVADPALIPGSLFLYYNRSAVEGPIASLYDFSPSGRTLTGGASPKGFPRSFSHGAQPALRTEATLSQYWADLGSGAALFANQFRLAGTGRAGRVKLFSSASATQPLICSWTGTTSNQNAFADYWDGSTFNIVSTSTTGGGQDHFQGLAKTAVGDLRVGDEFDYVFLHQTAKTWTLDIVREARDANDNGGMPVTIPTISGSYGSTINTATGPNGLVIGATADLSTGFGSWGIHTLQGFPITGSTPNDVVRYLTWARAQCRFSLLPYDQSAILVYPTDFVDTTHWADSGHLKYANAGGPAERAAVAALGLTGTVRVAILGDSRGTCTGASVPGTTDWGARMAAQSYSYTRLRVGPQTDAGGNPCFAVSGAVTRSDGTQHGHSQRTPDTFSIEKYVGPGKAYNNVNIWHIAIGVNDIVSSNAYTHYEMVDELCRIVEYLQANLTVPFAIILYDEPVTGSTTTGPAQRLLRERNRAYSRLVAFWRALGITVYRVATNDLTYNH